jgi:osmoprotectant transport system ATP-binding protein
MDEPFGAIDPITRESLQNEFLRLQEELRKTIVFVTHDIDEAIKMGDQIAVLGEQSVIRQHDTPERILAYPVDDYVNDFIGSGSTLKGLTFEQVNSLDLGDYPHISVTDPPEQGLALLESSDQEWLLVLDQQRHPSRWVRERDLRRINGSYDSVGTDVTAIVEGDASLYDTLEEMIQSASGVCCVVDDSGALEGVVELGHLSKVILTAQREAERHYEEELEERS